MVTYAKSAELSEVRNTHRRTEFELFSVIYQALHREM